MIPSKPYMIRAFHQWIVDNGWTPHIVVDAAHDKVDVPMEYVEDGRIVLNISPMACQGLHITNERIIFSARFGAVARQITMPPSAVLGIYARENGRGIIFGEDESDGSDWEASAKTPLFSVLSGSSDETDPKPPSGTDGTKTGSAKKPNLKVVK
ncbi:MAG: ClpXP protease specificity-enhancing factor [Gammaproteobacteria bacterium]